MITDAYTEKLSLWLDDELSDHEVLELQTHLNTCNHCRQNYAAMRHIDELLVSAATLLAHPAPGFVQRFEARLAGHQPPKLWQIWLALGALLTGTLLFFGGWAIVGSFTLLTLTSTLYDAGAYNETLLTLIDSANSLRFFLNMGVVIIKTSFIAMRQPLFWGSMVIATMMTWLWVRGLRSLLRSGMLTL